MRLFKGTLFLSIEALCSITASTVNGLHMAQVYKKGSCLDLFSFTFVRSKKQHKSLHIAWLLKIELFFASKKCNIFFYDITCIGLIFS